MCHRLVAALALLLAAAGVPAAAAERPRNADPAGLAEIVQRVESACKGVQDLSAKFSQTATNRALGQVQEASGLFLLKRPGKMRWEYQKPEAYLIVTDGKSLWVYRPVEKEVRVQEVEQAFSSRIPISFLAGDCDLKREFDISKVEHAGTRGSGASILDLKPKRPEGGIARVLLEVSLKNYAIEKTTLFDAYGNTTVVAFSDLKLNGGLSDSQFAFSPPPGVTVVRPPQR
ncbi:MAG: outer membrane lipoprotein chaperone LolA [candidate division NC10 bacterium]|nr:outer membrane lipoprotein chaperone LolA [candidate division NC10 bacterium]